MTQLSLLDQALQQPQPPEILVGGPAPTCRPSDAAGARLAANAARVFAGTDRALVLGCHAAHPDGLTDHEMAAILHREQTSVGVRRAELVRLGLVAPVIVDGHQARRPKLPGSTVLAGVWAITTEGLRVARDIDHPANFGRRFPSAVLP